MPDIVINPSLGKIDFFTVKGEQVTNSMRLGDASTILFTGALSASSITTGGGGAFVTSVQPTTNYLSKFTGNSTIANSLVYDNGTNVGIGTTVPSASLHINSTTAGATLLRTDGTNGTLFSVVDDLSDSLMSVNNSAGLPVLEVFTDDRIVAGQYGQNDFVVINNKVGIGTNNPLAKLHVTGSSSVPSAIFIGNVGIGSTSPGALLDVNGLFRFQQDIRVNNGTDKLILSATSTTTELHSAGTTGTIFKGAGNNEIVRFDATNFNVGIGTTTVSRKLHVYVDTGPVMRLQSSGSNASIEFIPSIGHNRYNWLIGAQQNISDAFEITPSTATNGTTFSTPAVLVKSDGNVGIGTTSPGYTLEVNGTQRVVGNFYLFNTVVNPATNFANQRGVGFEASTGKLEVAASGSTALAIGRYGSTGQILDFRYASTQIGNFSLDTNDLTLATARHLILSPTGNVGIGTTSPAAKLHIYNGSSHFEATSNGNAAIVSGLYALQIAPLSNRDSTAGSYYGGIAFNHLLNLNGVSTYNGAPQAWIGTRLQDTAGSERDYLVFATKPGTGVSGTGNDIPIERMCIDRDGLVGIGTTSPSNKTTIDADATGVSFADNAVAQLVIRGATDTTKRLGLGVDTTNNIGVIQAQKYGTAAYPLVLNPVGGNVGIGTTTTTDGLLSLNGTYPQLNINNPSTGSGVVIQLRDNGRAAGAIGHFTSTNYLQFSTAGQTAQITLTNIGNVGIGTTNPNSSLQVSGSVTIGPYNTLYSGTGVNSLNINATTYPVLAFYYGTTLGGILGAYSDHMALNTGAGGSKYISFEPGDSEIMRITAAGKVGIGTTSPSTPLAVQSNAKQLRLQTTSGPTVYFTDIGARYDSSHPFTIEVANGAETATEYFGIYADGGGANNRIALLNGNVGIGTTSPTINGGGLHVYGSGQKGIRISGNSSNSYSVEIGCDATKMSYIQTVGTADRGLQFYTGNASTVVMTLTGSNVGIGTTAPAVKLDVVGGDVIIRNDASGGSATLYLRNWAGSPTTTMVFGNNTGDDSSTSLTLTSNIFSITNYGDPGSSIQFGTRNSTTADIRLAINQDGNVGIGTTGPSQALHILTSNSGNNGLTIATTSATGNPQIRFLNSAGAEKAAITYASSADAVYFYTAASATNLMNFVGANVGIGTTSPVQKLSVVGNIYLPQSNFITWNNGDAEITAVSGYHLVFRTYTGVSMTEKLRITSGGNVGIGTTVPSATLHLNSTTSGATLLRADGTSGTLFSVVDDLSDSLMSVNNSAGLPVLEVFADDRIVGGQYGQNDLVVVNNKVGIGTNNPLAKLHVTGSTSVPAAVFLGDVGIGTSTINQKLSIYPGTTGGISLQDSSGIIRSYFFIDNNNPTFSTGIRTANYYLDFDSSGGSQNAIRFYTGTSTIGTGTERMRIDSGGNLLVGQSSITGANVDSFVYSKSGAYVSISHVSGTATGTGYIQFLYNNTQIGTILQSGTTAVTFNTTSDYRLKEDIQPLSSGLVRVNSLKPSIYKWKSDGSNGEGFIAHELAEVVPVAVTGEKDAVNKDGSINPQGVDMSKVVPILVAAIQELSAIVKTLEAKVQILESK